MELALKYVGPVGPIENSAVQIEPAPNSPHDKMWKLHVRFEQNCFFLLHEQTSE